VRTCVRKPRRTTTYQTGSIYEERAQVKSEKRSEDPDLPTGGTNGRREADARRKEGKGGGPVNETRAAARL